MKRQEAIRVLTGRLRSSRVRHSAGFDSGQMQITMGFNAVYAPDHRIAVSYTHLTLPTKA